MSPAFLDYNATTPIAPSVRDTMEPWLGERFGNPASRDHRWGWDASEAVEEARGAVAQVAGCDAGGVVFLSGATEAINVVLRTYVERGDPRRHRIVIGASEHEAVMATSRHLCRRSGTDLVVLPVNELGHIRLDHLTAALEPCQNALVALMAANNEIGTIHPLHEISEAVHGAGGQWLCDTTQAFGRTSVDLGAVGIDFATISAHKMYGPKGVGALLVRAADPELQLEPLIVGGGQERGVRGGTLNVPGIVGLGAAGSLVQRELDDDVRRMRWLRDRLEEGILSEVPGAWTNGDRANRLCNTTSIGFKGIDARALIRDMNDIAVSTRSACSSDDRGPSHVLKAIGLSDEDAYSCVRFSLGRFTTLEEIDYALDKVVISVRKLRRLKST